MQNRLAMYLLVMFPASNAAQYLVQGCLPVMALDYQPFLDYHGYSKLLQTTVSAGGGVHKFLRLSETNVWENTI